MKSSSLKTVLAAAFLLPACDPRTAREEQAEAAADDRVSAEGKAEEGKISLKMPGVDMTLSLPKGAADEVRAERDSKLLYPGATLRGMAVSAGPGSDRSGDSEVEFRFSTSDPLDKVADWYRDPARAEGFHLEKSERDGGALLLTGLQKKDDHRFRLRLSGREGGGTDGRLTVRHQD